MKNIFKFLLFISYSTITFFIPNNELILLFILINIIAMILTNTNVKKAIKNLISILPFILITVVINFLLGYRIEAIWIGIKLLIVCNITFIYSKTTTIGEVAKTIKDICAPLKIFKINTNEIEILVCISLSMIPILRKEYVEIKDACKAKNMKFNLKNMKIILQKILISFIKRVCEIDEALIEKGCEY